MRTARAPLYYGWVLVGIGFFTMLLVQGTFLSAGVLFAALTHEYGWSRATTALPFSVSLAGYAATAWLAGRWFDRYGPRRLYPLGATLLGLGVILSTYARTPWHLCLTWGVLAGQGLNLIGFVPHLAHMALWFQRRRGLASGLLLSGASMGALVLVPGMQYLVNQYGWRLAYWMLGLLIIVCLVPLNVVWQRHRPADLGLALDGAAIPAPVTTPSVHVVPQTIWTLAQALRTIRFWYLFVMVGGIGWISNVTSVHQIAHITDNGFPSLLAASLIGFMGLIRAAGSPLWGALADRFGREGIYLLGTLLCIVGLGCFAALTPGAPLWLLYGYVLAYGFGYGVNGAIESTSTADIFQGPHLGSILGALELGWGFGGFLGAWCGGFWYDSWGSYHGAYVLTIGVNLLGCLALWLAAPRRERAARLASVPTSP